MSCASCRNMHKTCDGGRPCQRCSKAKRECIDAPKGQKGRPKRARDEAAAVVVSCPDQRIASAHKVILSHPELIFSEPVGCASAFGITLCDEYWVCHLPKFEDTMTLQDYERNMVVKCVSPLFQEFLGANKNVSVWSDFMWLSSICLPPAGPNNCMREAVQRMILKNQVRSWKNVRTIRAHDSHIWECDLQGHILPNLTVMYVEVVAKRRAKHEDSEDVHTPQPFIWHDEDMPELTSCEFFDHLVDFEQWNV